MSIEVHVRIRPNVPNTVWSSAETVLYSTHNPNTRYVYNKVHHIGTTNQNIFQGIEALVHAGFDGKNVTVMAYGQTGSGKTHSMNGTEGDPGVVPRTAKLLLDLRKNYPGTQVVVYFTEIYNESVKDLLEPQRGELALHDAPDGTVFFDKKSVPIETIDDFINYQTAAERNRKYGVTNLNDHSSRSHMILTFEINRTHRQTSTINLVDLAGSESAARANTEGVSLREGGFINKSLLTLGNVVDAIVEKRPYVPYRDAKLTRILRNCLGGSGMTFVLCCINPSHENFEQTVASLRFTQRAMKIKNDPVMVLNMPPLFAHQYSAGAAELVDNLEELANAQYQRGLRDAFLYTSNTMSSVTSHFDGQVSDSLHAMANAQRLLIAHDHAMGIEQVGGLYNRLHELTQQQQQSKDILEHERKRQREAVEEIEVRNAKIARLEAELKERDSDADTELAGWEYQLYEARQRRIMSTELLFVSERARRFRLQYEWAVCIERIAARCVPAIKALGPVTPPVADKHTVLKEMRQRLLEARAELADLTVAHDMIKGDLPDIIQQQQQQQKQQNLDKDDADDDDDSNDGRPQQRPPPRCAATVSPSPSVSPQPRPNGNVLDPDVDIDSQIRDLEREERLLMSRAVHVARCESARRIRASLRHPTHDTRSRTPPTSRSAPRQYIHSALPPSSSSPAPEAEGGEGLPDRSPGAGRGGTTRYASPPKVRSPTPRTARSVFPLAEPNEEAEEDAGKEEHLADGVRRALGVLRDVRSKLMRQTHSRRRRQTTESPPPEVERRTQKATAPLDEEMTVLEVYKQHTASEKAAPPIGIAARRRMEGAPVRPNVERALWRMSMSPASMEAPERSRSRRG